MRLYHYTHISCVPAILSEGLRIRQAVFSIADLLPSAVHLTTDPSPAGHGLSSGAFATKIDCQALGLTLTSGQQIPFFANKRKVRITVNSANIKVNRWHRWARTNLSPEVFSAAVQTGGGMKKARTWYLSFGNVSLGAIMGIEVRKAGKWVDYTQYDGPAHEVVSDQAWDIGYLEWGERLGVGLRPDLLVQYRAAKARFDREYAATRASIPTPQGDDRVSDERWQTRQPVSVNTLDGVLKGGVQ